MAVVVNLSLTENASAATIGADFTVAGQIVDDTVFPQVILQDFSGGVSFVTIWKSLTAAQRRTLLQIILRAIIKMKFNIDITNPFSGLT